MMSGICQETYLIWSRFIRLTFIRLGVSYLYSRPLDASKIHVDIIKRHSGARVSWLRAIKDKQEITQAQPSSWPKTSTQND